jgi:hypothetical protein
MFKNEIPCSTTLRDINFLNSSQSYRSLSDRFSIRSYRLVQAIFYIAHNLFYLLITILCNKFSILLNDHMASKLNLII